MQRVHSNASRSIAFALFTKYTFPTCSAPGSLVLPLHLFQYAISLSEHISLHAISASTINRQWSLLDDKLSPDDWCSSIQSNRTELHHFIPSSLGVVRLPPLHSCRLLPGYFPSLFYKNKYLRQASFFQISVVSSGSESEIHASMFATFNGRSKIRTHLSAK